MKPAIRFGEHWYIGVTHWQDADDDELDPREDLDEELDRCDEEEELTDEELLGEPQ
jgi:hypothetical protein